VSGYGPRMGHWLAGSAIGPSCGVANCLVACGTVCPPSCPIWHGRAAGRFDPQVRVAH